MFGLNHSKLVFQTIQTNSILNLLKNWDVNKTARIDKSFGKFLKDGVDVLAIPITQICNISHFLKNCKVAKLKPLYKKGANTNPKNFRPISLLSYTTKL